MVYFEEVINRQITSSKGKNIFHHNPELCIGKEISDVCALLGGLSKKSLEFLIEYTVERTIREICRINQYYSFNKDSRQELKTIYSKLLDSLNKPACSLNVLSQKHYKNLADWLIKYNPFAQIIYRSCDSFIKPVSCYEYSVELQMEILHIDHQNIYEPVLDIGCGENGHFVHHLAKLNIDAIGIDRFNTNSGKFHQIDWLAYNYGNEKWGLIISNLGFSNHFNHHHLRKDGNYTEYAKVYMHILRSLKIGGRFHYAPDLQFIEKYLDSSKFLINKYALKKFNFDTTVITRLK